MFPYTNFAGRKFINLKCAVGCSSRCGCWCEYEYISFSVLPSFLEMIQKYFPHDNLMSGVDPVAQQMAAINFLSTSNKLTHRGLVAPYSDAGPCITNVIATCRKNFSQWESSFLWKLRCHWLKFLRRVAKTLVIQGPDLDQHWRRSVRWWPVA